MPFVPFTEKIIISGPSNNPSIPEIYQIEISERCNFHCDFCQTGEFGGKSKKDPFIHLDLLNTIIERDLGGSYFIELQHRGEPLLNKHLSKIIDKLKPYVFLGLSTNGSLIHTQIEALLKLDFLTISIDASNKTTYEVMRKGGHWETLLNNIDLLLLARGSSPYPSIDLQLVKIDGHECDTKGVQNIAKANSWNVRVRELQDCFPELNNPDKFRVENNELCLNPWTSVSIHKNGNVVPCCRVWNTEWVYGNLYDESLEDIWKGQKVAEFQQLHRDGTNLPFFCRSCFSRSPSYLHLNLYQNAVNDMIRRGATDRVIQVQAKSNKNTG